MATVSPSRTARVVATLVLLNVGPVGVDAPGAADFLGDIEGDGARTRKSAASR